jgi:hypothetical protein
MTRGEKGMDPPPARRMTVFCRGRFLTCPLVGRVLNPTLRCNSFVFARPSRFYREAKQSQGGWWYYTPPFVPISSGLQNDI